MSSRKNDLISSIKLLLMVIAGIIVGIASWLAVTVAVPIVTLAILPIAILIKAFIDPYKQEKMRMHYASKYKSWELDSESEWQKDFDKDMEQPDIPQRLLNSFFHIKSILLAINDGGENTNKEIIKDQLKKFLKINSDTNFNYTLFIFSSIAGITIVPLVYSAVTFIELMVTPLASIPASIKRGISAATAVGKKLDACTNVETTSVNESQQAGNDLEMESEVTTPSQSNVENSPQNQILHGLELHKSASNESLARLASADQNQDQDNSMPRKYSLNT